MTDNDTSCIPPPTERIAFRRIAEADIPLLHLLNHDDGVMRYLDHQPPGEEEVREEVRKILADYARWPQYGHWIATCRSTGEYMGWFALSMRKEDASGLELELGYRLRPRFWGQGLASEGSRMLVGYGFEMTQKVRRVYGETMGVNAGSRRVMEKSGMRCVRRFWVEFPDPLPGTEEGEVEYEIRREEWKER